MPRSTSSQNNRSNPSTPHGNAGKSSASPAAGAENQIKSKIAKLESIHTKNAAAIQQFNVAIDQKESYQAQLHGHHKDFMNNHQASQPIIKKVIDSNMDKLLTTSPGAAQTLNGPIDKIALAKLMTTDPELLPLGNQLRTINENIRKEENNINNVQKKIDTISRTKNSLKKDLEKSKIELGKSIDALLATKAGAANELELDHLLSIAHQRIAAADFLQAGDQLAQAERYSLHTKNSLHDSFKKMDKLFVQLGVNQRELNAAQDKFISDSRFNDIGADPKKYKEWFLQDPANQALANATMATLAQTHLASQEKENIAAEHAKAKISLDQAQAEFQQAESTLQKLNSAVADAQSALDRHNFANTLTDMEEDAASTIAAPHPATDDSAALDETQVYEPVIAVGTEDHLELF